ncbi:CCR4-NOT transcription complex subunit 3 [Fasciola hepatica]|uniref:CCR4-NOT transcription complex subunit 3 n=1 Tax=Fasciola hepatica TaxID=6192 RepID=A0A4E0QXE6_FASHE|nr:CCR4-NOT transcription complex subunit 3 [Fasciola hepatica]
MDARKDIEYDMERFKIIEKETKTKAYSKEGLLSTDAKKDPLQKEKEEIDEWLKQCISSLKKQTEKYEFEIESLTNGNKKKRNDKETALAIKERRQRLELCLFHVEKLETIMRLLDNEKLECAKVRAIQEPIEYVIDCSDDASILDYKDVYDDLRLDEIGDSSGITPGVVASPPEHELNGVPNPTVVANYRPGKDDAGSSASTHTSTSNHTDSAAQPGSSSSSNASSSRERTKSDEKVLPLTAVSASSTSTPLKPSSGTGGGSCSKHKGSNVANQTAPPALMSQVVAGTPNKANRTFCTQVVNGTSHGLNSPGENGSVKSRAPTEVVPVAEMAGRSHKTDSTNKHNDRHMTIPTQAPSELQSQHSAYAGSDQGTDSNSSPTGTPNSNTLVSPVIVPTSNVVTTVASVNPSVGCKMGFSAAMSSQSLSPLTNTNSVSSSISALSSSPISTSGNQPKLPSNSLSANHIPLNLLQVNALTTGQDKHFSGILSSTVPTSTLQLDGQLSATGLETPLTSSLASKLQSVAAAAAAASQGLSLSSSVIPSVTTQGQSVHVAMDKQIPGLSGQLHSQVSHHPHSYTQMHPRDVAAPFRNRNLDTTKGPMAPELLLQMQALEIGYRRLPHPCDTEKARMIVYKNTVPCPDYYPQEPLPGTDSEEYYMKLDAQTLFFIFYYFEGTKAQYFAAKALKRMSWRFHTKLMMWFQRHEEPKEITDEFESGSYIYYDFKTMSQQKKDQFVFHYTFLEDKDF